MVGFLDRVKKEQRDDYEAMYPSMYGFWAKGAPTVFQWVEWCAVLSLVRYAQVKSGLWALLAIQVVLWIFLWGYFTAFFMGYDPKWRSGTELRSQLVGNLTAWVATAAMVSASWWIARIFVKYPL